MSVCLSFRSLNLKTTLPNFKFFLHVIKGRKWQLMFEVENLRKVPKKIFAPPPKKKKLSFGGCCSKMLCANLLKEP